MEGQRQIKEMTPLAQYYYNMAQCFTIKYQMERGFIDDPLGYDESAELFHLMADRHITIPRVVDYVQMRLKIQEITGEVNKVMG